MKTPDLTKILKGYENRWVAIAPDYKRVVGSGKTLKAAQREALGQGFKEPILTKVFPFSQGYIPCFGK